MPLSGTNSNHLGPLRHLTPAPELGLLVEPGLSLLALETAPEKVNHRPEHFSLSAATQGAKDSCVPSLGISVRWGQPRLC